MNEEEVKLLETLLLAGWGNVAGTLFSPKATWKALEEEALSKLMLMFDYKYGGIK